MDPYTGLPWQYPLNGYQTTGNGSRAPLPTSTAQAAVPVGMQFHDLVGGQAYMVQPYAGDDTDLFEFGMPGVFGYDDPMLQVQYTMPQVIQPAPAPAPAPVPVPVPVPVPATAPPADPCADNMKSVIFDAFAEALAATQQERLPPLEQLARLEDFRKTCGRLINQSWHATRVDLARDIAKAALPLYRQLAPKVAAQAQTRVMPFFGGFEPWGLKTLNASLARMPLLGHVVQFSVVPPDDNGTVHAPMLPILRSPQAQAGQTPQQFRPPVPPPLAVPVMPPATGTTSGGMQDGGVHFATANVPFASLRAPSRDRPSYRDEAKVQVWEAYSRLLEVLAHSGTSPATRLETLMSFRDISRQLINKAWAGLRLDIAGELISLAVSAYDCAARELQPNSVCPLPEFFDSFVPSGLAVMNEALSGAALGTGSLQGKLVLARMMPVAQQAPQTGDVTVGAEREEWTASSSTSPTTTSNSNSSSSGRSSSAGSMASTNPHLARQGRRS